MKHTLASSAAVPMLSTAVPPPPPPDDASMGMSTDTKLLLTLLLTLFLSCVVLCVGAAVSFKRLTQAMATRQLKLEEREFALNRKRKAEEAATAAHLSLANRMGPALTAGGRQ